MNFLDELLRRAYDAGYRANTRDADPASDPLYAHNREQRLRAIVTPAHVGAQSATRTDEE